MEGGVEIIFWQRTDLAGLERLALDVSPAGISAMSSLICVEDGGYRLDHSWEMSPDWRVHSVQVEKWGAGRPVRLRLERNGNGWKVDGMQRPDLDGADEPDLSVTPFCNSFPIRRLMGEKRDTLTVDTCYIDAALMTVTRSRQRYDWLRPKFLRYVDLGLHSGFEAILQVDNEGLVIAYENLFERVGVR